jgi:hypothetical protein
MTTTVKVAVFKSTARMTRCADCTNETPIDGLAKTLFQCDGLSERLDPGSEVPAGECECGAFAYLIPTADQQLSAIEIARYVRDLLVDEFFATDELPNIEWLKTKLQDAGMPISQSAVVASCTMKEDKAADTQNGEARQRPYLLVHLDAPSVYLTRSEARELLDRAADIANGEEDFPSSADLEAMLDEVLADARVSVRGGAAPFWILLRAPQFH